MSGFLRKHWDRVAAWFADEATHVTVAFIEEPGVEPLEPYRSYLRLWLTEGFLADSVSWGASHFPALHGGVSLDFLGGTPTFSTFTRPPEKWTVPGAQFDFHMTPLVPYNGGVVEVEAALYQASVDGPLGTAVGLLGGLMALVGPPLATAAAIVDKASDGLDAVLTATGDQPVLGVHWSMISAGGGGHVLVPGHLVVVNAPPGRCGPLSLRGQRLHCDQGAGPVPMTGADYLVLRVEGRVERDDWRFPELDALIRAAGAAYIEGHTEDAGARRKEAIVRAWNSADLTPADRKRVAKLVADEIDEAKSLGIARGPDVTIAAMAPAKLLASDAPELEGVTLDMLLAG